MPGSVSNAVPTRVMPWSLCLAFTHSREYPVIDNEYRNGESQRSRQADTSLKRWSTQRRLAPTLLAVFREFFGDCDGGMEPFWFYDPWETSPKFSYDSTGVATVGRHVARFDCGWSQLAGIARADVQLDIIEIA